MPIWRTEWTFCYSTWDCFNIFSQCHVVHFVFCWCKDTDIHPKTHYIGNIVILSDLFVHLIFTTLSHSLLISLRRYDSFLYNARFFICPKAVCQNIIHYSVWLFDTVILSNLNYLLIIQNRVEDTNNLQHDRNNNIIMCV